MCGESREQVGSHADCLSLSELSTVFPIATLSLPAKDLYLSSSTLSVFIVLTSDLLHNPRLGSQLARYFLAATI